MPTVHTVSTPAPGTHRFRVQSAFPADSARVLFPSWAPGSYLMREFARNVRDIHAWLPGGEPVAVERVSRNEWHVATDGPFVLAYDVYAREKSVRTPYLDEELVFFLPTNLLAYAPERRDDGHVVELDVAAGHTGVCPLGPAVVGPGTARWEAADLDTFNDSPVTAAAFACTTFEVAGVPHRHWVEPGHNGDLARINEDLRRIVTTAAAQFGGTVPYRSYDFVTLWMQRGHGGLEHKDGCVLLRPRTSLVAPKDYEEFVTLAAHEHFHAWNVKRIHPDTLGPRFDYEREHYTRDLWWLEGGTVYYEERIVYRAGLVDRARHLERLGALAAKLDTLPGRHHQSLEDSSLDAWIKLYRQGEDSPNSTVSYYLKGAVVIWAMDLELLHRTGGAHGVDTLLQRLWEGWGRHGRGYPERTALRDLAAEIAGSGGADPGDWARWWDQHVRGTGPVQIAEALDHAGYDLAWAPPRPGGWLGVECSDRLVIDSVREDGPSADALAPGDELLAVDGLRVASQATLGDRLRDLAPGSLARILLSRDGRVLERSVRASSPPRGDLKIVERTGIDTTRRLVRSRWLDL
jgi:predicted metalloprotease with PDZ domain